MKKYSMFIIFLLLFFSTVIFISILIPSREELKIEIKKCIKTENSNNYYFFDEENKKLIIWIISNSCCSEKIFIEETNTSYKIFEKEEDNVICNCDCNREIIIHNAKKLNIEFFNFKKEKVHIEEFCGISTYSYCESNNDCIVGGCSGEICQGKNEEIFSICIWKECYKNLKNHRCACINNRCRWI